MTDTATWGNPSSFAKLYEAEFPVRAGAHSTVRATVSVAKAELAAPFTITLHPSRDRALKLETTGTWVGTGTWNLTCAMDAVIDSMLFYIFLSKKHKPTLI